MLPEPTAVHRIPDTDLLHLSRRLLKEADFVVKDFDGQPPILLAENPHFLLAVVATTSVSGFPDAEDAAMKALAERIPRDNPGPKKWDGYVVILTRDTASAETDGSEFTQSLYDLVYDRYGMRRIAHVGVEPTPAGVRGALANFFALPADSSISGTSLSLDPLSDLSDALTKHRVDVEIANRAIAMFQSGVRLPHEL